VDTRYDLSPTQRAVELIHSIDPGFVHYRKIEMVVGGQNMGWIDSRVRSIPTNLPSGLRCVRVDHIYTEALVHVCATLPAPPLEALLSAGRGAIFSSTEQLAPNVVSNDGKRAISKWIPRGPSDLSVEFHYSTEHIHGDTVRSQLGQGGVFAIIAVSPRRQENTVIFEPLVIGFPWWEDPSGLVGGDSIMYMGAEWNQNYVEDFDEFKDVLREPDPPSPDPMKDVPEAGVRAAFARLLGDAHGGDWGGEASDFYTSHLHLAGTRVTGAFLFKGPARFRPMNLNQLGANNDQIVRLANEPADVLFVQHSHDILPAVRATLRAFAVQPTRPRRYCLIDGRDTLRLLRAYDLCDFASGFKA
jgi:hypothetical protein